MSLQVVWSPIAKDEFANTLIYIEVQFGTDAALKLLEQTDNTIRLLSKFPMMFEASSLKAGVRKAKVTKRATLLYRVQKSRIEILHYWDNMRDT